ncbi:MAG: hypothetical protein J6112_05020 [Clostridia bacterium]|nr:hypothetical protein [Clostridia bacterium]
MIDNLRGDLIKINKLEELYKDYYASSFRYFKAKGIYTPGFVWDCGDVDAAFLKKNWRYLNRSLS